MNRIEVEKTLADVFNKRFSLDFLNNPKMKEMKLLSRAGIPARELLHVYFDVKDIFNITVPEEDIDCGRFDTFINITNIICEQLEIVN